MWSVSGAATDTCVCQLWFELVWRGYLTIQHLVNISPCSSPSKATTSHWRQPKGSRNELHFFQRISSIIDLLLMLINSLGMEQIVKSGSMYKIIYWLFTIRKIYRILIKNQRWKKTSSHKLSSSLLWSVITWTSNVAYPTIATG